jgi:phosphomannomutase / phosphoglucomutase
MITASHNDNPNPKDMKMLHVMAEKVRATGADVGLGFDGDRCGVVDKRGEDILAVKIGVMLARDLGKVQPGAPFVVDVRSMGL